jgi:hypothetical protein
MNEQHEREFYFPERRECPTWGLVFVIGLALMIFAGLAKAQTPTCAWNSDCLKWDRPTTRVDGSTLLSTEVASYDIEAALFGSLTWTKVGTVNAPTQSFTRTNIKASEIWQYRVIVVLTSGARSDPSNVQVGPATVEPAPSPAVLKTVDTLAYEINKATDAIKLAAVGTVPLGVTCSPQYDANGLNVVPRDLVKFKTTTRPLVVVAKCG